MSMGAFLTLQARPGYLSAGLQERDPVPSPKTSFYLIDGCPGRNTPTAMTSVESAKKGFREVGSWLLLYSSFTLELRKTCIPWMKGGERHLQEAWSTVCFQFSCTQPACQSSCSLSIGILFIVFKVCLPPVKLNVWVLRAKVQRSSSLHSLIGTGHSRT